MMNAPAVPTTKPSGLIGETRWPPVQYITRLQPITVPQIPVAGWQRRRRDRDPA